MANVTVRALKNGPYEVAGRPQVLDLAGVPLPDVDDPIYLCRCGQSAKKPFCDGTHKKTGFQAEGWVRPSSTGR